MGQSIWVYIGSGDKDLLKMQYSVDVTTSASAGTIASTIRIARLLIVSGIATNFSLVVDVGPATAEIDDVGVDAGNIVSLSVFSFVIVVESDTAFDNCVVVATVSVSVVVNFVDVGLADVEIDAVGVDVDNIVLFNVFVFVIVVESVAAFNNCVAVTAVSVSVVVDIIDV
jgi:hypothetical protein